MEPTNRDRTEVQAHSGSARPARRRVGRARLPLTIAALDLLLIVLATLIAIQFRVALPYFGTASDVVLNTAPAAVFVTIAWLAVLAMIGAYDHDIMGAGSEEFRNIVNGSLGTAALVGVSAFLLKFPLSRGFFLLLFVVGIPLLLIGRVTARRILQRLRQRGHLSQRVLLIGTPGHLGEINSVLQRERWLGYEVVGCLVPTDYAGLTETSSGIPVIGHTDTVRDHVDETGVDIVFFTAGAAASSKELRRIAWDLEDHAHVQIIVAPNLTDVSAGRVRIRPVAGLPLMHLGRPRSQVAASGAKRAFDVLGSLALLSILGPVMLTLALWVRLSDGGPALYRQTRVGRDGEEFTCLKFRSMVVNADQIRPETESDHVLYKMEDDPRITRPGRTIRRFSLDELPQLINVLRGEMSLVGPRPPLADEVAQYEDDMLRRLNVLPGMTGLWQVSGRSDLSWEDTVRLDLYYVDNWSMMQDLMILARTFSAVLAGRGAY